MKPIEKIEAGAEQMYDELSQSLTTKYYEFATDINEYFHMKLRSVAVYAFAFALLLGGFSAICIFGTYAIAEMFELATWKVAGGVGFVLLTLSIAIIAFYRLRSVPSSKKLTEQMRTNADQYVRSLNKAAQSHYSNPLSSQSAGGSEAADGIEKVKDGLSELFSPVYHIKKHPFKTIGIAAATGIFLGIQQKRSPASRQVSRDKIPDSAREQISERTSGNRPAKSQQSGIWPSTYALVAPLIVHALRKKLTNGIEDYINNFDIGSLLKPREFENEKKKESSFKTVRSSEKEKTPPFSPHEDQHESYISYLKH